MHEFWWALIGLLIGLALGALIYRLLAPAAQEASVEKLKQENARFHDQVNDHFVETANLINQLTDSYKAVFDHLSSGASELVDPETLRKRLPATDDREVRLRRIGPPRDKPKS